MIQNKSATTWENRGVRGVRDLRRHHLVDEVRVVGEREVVHGAKDGSEDGRASPPQKKNDV